MILPVNTSAFFMASPLTAVPDVSDVAGVPVISPAAAFSAPEPDFPPTCKFSVST